MFHAVIFLPRTLRGWIAWAVIVASAAAVGHMVSPAAGAIGFGVLAFSLGSIAIAFVEAWRAELWRGSRPPDRITPDAMPDYLAWQLRRLRDRHPGSG